MTSVTTLTLRAGSPAEQKTDAVVIGIGTTGPGLPGTGKGKGPGKGSAKPRLVLAEGAQKVDAAMKGTLLATLTALGAAGKPDEVVKLPSSGAVKAPVLVAVGLGAIPADGPVAHETLRRAAGAAARALAGTNSAAFALPAGDGIQLAAVAEGALLGAYAFDTFRGRSESDRKQPLASAVVIAGGDLDAKGKAAKAAANRARILAQAVHLARDLVNTPPSHLHPAELAEAARRTATEVGGVEVEVLDEKDLAAAGYGGILGVGAGSANPPRLVRLAYRPRKPKAHLALVGKGITFDSGGLSLKPPNSMITMKSDMAGAASVIAAVTAISALGLPVSVTGYAALAENMPSGTAIRPSDVLTMYGGKTVEVLNTDAEGRLVLADAIVRAGQDNPDALVDIATLTGAQVVALGTRTSAVMANDDALRAQVSAAGERVGEPSWPMPLPDELRATLDSSVADIANVGDRNGGMLAAGVFLREFVADGLRWAHMDVAGPSFNEAAPHGYTPKGATGVPVRTLVALAEDLADGALPAR